MSAWLHGQRLMVLLFVAATLGWFARPGIEEATPLVQARRDVWSVASLPAQPDASSLALQLAGAPIWGPETKKQENAAPIENMRWRLAGVYGAGKVGGALILFDDPNRPPLRLKVGEKLPSGHVIDSVDGNQVCVRIEKKLYRFGVERRE